MPPQSSKVVIPSRPQPRSRGESLPCSCRSPERSRKEVEGTSEESAFGPPLHDELTFLRKRFVSGHGFSRAATVFQSCHSQPSAATLAARACPERSEGTREESAFGPPVHYEPIFLHREIRIRARLQPCRQVTKSKVPCRYGATTEKPDTLVAVAPHGCVNQPWKQNTARLKPCPDTNPLAFPRLTL